MHALQDATTLTPLDSAAQPSGLPSPDPTVGANLRFFEKLRVWSQAFPPASRDRELQDSFASIGLGDVGTSPYVSPDAETASALYTGLAAGKKELDSVLLHGASLESNGWKLTFHAFDYNLDFFEVGTLDDPRFKIADPNVRILERAGAAKGGLWGNHAWLPAPAGDFRPVLRMYEPAPSVLDGTYVVPAIIRS